MRRIALTLILLSTAIVSMASATPLQCEDMYSAKPINAWQPIRTIRENWAALVSRVKPTYKSKYFDVRILSSNLSRNTFSPAALREIAIQEVGSLQASYRDMGFSFRSFVQVLVEAHPNAMGQLGLSDSGKYIWNDRDKSTPWIGHAGKFIGIPNLLGQQSLFVGRADKKGFEQMPRFLIMPAVTSTYQSIQNRFAIAHELAHLTENPKSHQDMMWIEARADFLAFLTTGHTDVVFPEGIDLEFTREDGSTYIQRVTVVRSISHPAIASVQKLWPSLDAYHHNSQILSSALYKISQTIGRDRAIEFVLWMDRLAEVDVIPYLEPKPNESDQDFKPTPHTEYIDNKDLSVVRSAIGEHLSRVGQLFRRWSNEANLATNEIAILLEILSEHGI